MSLLHVTAHTPVLWREQGYVHNLLTIFLFSQDKKDFIEKRVKRLLKAGVTSALAVMVKADNSILTEQSKEMLARYKTKLFIAK